MVMTDSQPKKKKRIAIAETDAVYSDEEGETHLKTEALSKSGGSSKDEDKE
jgi:hypothetical protein